MRQEPCVWGQLAAERCEKGTAGGTAHHLIDTSEFLEKEIENRKRNCFLTDKLLVFDLVLDIFIVFCFEIFENLLA